MCDHSSFIIRYKENLHSGNISGSRISIRASSIYSLAFMLTFRLAGSLMSVQEATAQLPIKLTVTPVPKTGVQTTVAEGVTTTVTVTATLPDTIDAETIVTITLPDDDEGNFLITGNNITAGEEDRTLDITVAANGDATGMYRLLSRLSTIRYTKPTRRSRFPVSRLTCSSSPRPSRCRTTITN